MRGNIGTSFPSLHEWEEVEQIPSSLPASEFGYMKVSFTKAMHFLEPFSPKF
jgi:hypothetical protein